MWTTFLYYIKIIFLLRLTQYDNLALSYYENDGIIEREQKPYVLRTEALSKLTSDEMGQTGSFKVTFSQTILFRVDN